MSDDPDPVSAITADRLLASYRGVEHTPESIWLAIAGSPITDDLLAWPPDVFALINVTLGQSEAFRFAISPVGEWPPGRYPDWSGAVGRAARRWGAWVENQHGAIPDMLADEWAAFRERAEMPVERVAQGDDWRMCEALLTLHAIADESCAGLGVALDTLDAEACVYRARGRELLARTGSLARINPRLLRVLPKVRTPPTGRATFSRYACVVAPGVDARWNKMPARHRGTDLTSEYATILLLPWPLRVRTSDFRPVEGSVRRPAKEPYGFFEFTPAEGLDLDLLDRVLVAAREESGNVDVVVLPESAVEESEIDALEALLDRHGVVFLQTGVRQRRQRPAAFGRSWVHCGVNPRLEKGGPLPSAEGAPWFHIRQNKHHRWSLDESQVYQYHLGGALHPDIRWWEAIDVPRRAVQFIEVAELTIASLVCEDLAWNDEIAALIRSVGPTVVWALLLDGPQLTSRWSARYASVLADDPGCSVLTLTSYGMVQRSRPPRRDASSVIALSKDPGRGMREIPLESGAHGVLLSVCMDRTTRRAADGRWPVDTGTHAFIVGVQQVRAANSPSESSRPRNASSTPHILEAEELTILTAWAEGVAEALAYAPDRVDSLVDNARSGADWRAELGLPNPTSRLGEAIDAMGELVRPLAGPSEAAALDAAVVTLHDEPPGESNLEGLVRLVQLAMLEERRTRQPAPVRDEH